MEDRSHLSGARERGTVSILDHLTREYVHLSVVRVLPLSTRVGALWICCQDGQLRKLLLRSIDHLDFQESNIAEGGWWTQCSCRHLLCSNYNNLSGYGFLQVLALAYGRDHRTKLIELMNQKEAVGDVFNQLRLALQRRTAGRPAQVRSRPLLAMPFTWNS